MSVGIPKWCEISHPTFYVLLSRTRHLHQVNGYWYINARLAVRALFMAGFKKLAIRLRILSVNVVATMLVEYGLNLDVAVGAKTQHGPVCDVADQKKAKKHDETLLACVSSRWFYHRTFYYTTSEGQNQVLYGACTKVPTGFTLLANESSYQFTGPVEIAGRDSIHIIPGV